jgi:hypothetical protein
VQSGKRPTEPAACTALLSHTHSDTVTMLVVAAAAELRASTADLPSFHMSGWRAQVCFNTSLMKPVLHRCLAGACCLACQSPALNASLVSLLSSIGASAASPAADPCTGTAAAAAAGAAAESSAHGSTQALLGAQGSPGAPNGPQAGTVGSKAKSSRSSRVRGYSGYY